MQQPVTRAMLVWTVVILVVLSFLGSLLGAFLAKDTTAAPEPTPTAIEPPADEVSADEIYPAGSDMRAGQGAPAEGTGADGDVYIDTVTANVWVHRNGTWQMAGNIRESAAENLTGETGAAGAPGASGAPGQPGTSVILGTGAPDPITCSVEGDIYIDTTVSQYYSCVEGEWTLFGPAEAPVEG
jgi:hypothetical protein